MFCFFSLSLSFVLLSLSLPYLFLSGFTAARLRRDWMLRRSGECSSCGSMLLYIERLQPSLCSPSMLERLPYAGQNWYLIANKHIDRLVRELGPPHHSRGSMILALSNHGLLQPHQSRPPAPTRRRCDANHLNAIITHHLHFARRNVGVLPLSFLLSICLTTPDWRTLGTTTPPRTLKQFPAPDCTTTPDRRGWRQREESLDGKERGRDREKRERRKRRDRERRERRKEQKKKKKETHINRERTEEIERKNKTL